MAKKIRSAYGLDEAINYLEIDKILDKECDYLFTESNKDKNRFNDRKNWRYSDIYTKAWDSMEFECDFGDVVEYLNNH